MIHVPTTLCSKQQTILLFQAKQSKIKNDTDIERRKNNSLAEAKEQDPKTDSNMKDQHPTYSKRTRTTLKTCNEGVTGEGKKGTHRKERNRRM
ncbi:hypothetical protein QL285_029860 [Trifolium repens]|nr:hypothetical protein QL285_029860 [Trifolium repens]